MAKNTKTYTVFLSGPFDVGSDITFIKQIIAEINILLHHSKIRFEAYHWIDDLTPGAGSEAQERVNRQSAGYDIIISLLAGKIGTPTSRYASGTVEEIELALLSRETLSFKDDSIKVFFKKGTINTAHGDLESALAVQNFRKDLGKRKVTYKEYIGDENLREYILKAFSSIISQHLDDLRRVEGDGGKDGKSSHGSTLPVTIREREPMQTAPDDEVQLGALDFEAMSTSRLLEATSKAQVIASSIEALAAHLNTSSEDIGSATKRGDRPMVYNVVKSVASKMAETAEIVQHASAELPILFGGALDALEQIIYLSVDDPDMAASQDQLFSLKTVVEGVIGEISTSLNAGRGFQMVMAGLPNLSRDFTKSSRSLYKAIEQYIKAAETIIERAAELVNLIK